jgi:hypothetical protein
MGKVFCVTAEQKPRYWSTWKIHQVVKKLLWGRRNRNMGSRLKMAI